MELAIVLILLGTGVVNGLPLLGIAGAGALRALYGVAVTDPDLLVLMRHRAVLLGLLGAALAGAAFVPSWRLPAIVAGLVSMGVFVVLALGAPGSKIATTMIVDVVLCAALGVALALHLIAG